MKKVVRMLGLCALVALAFTACKKNETNSTLTFKAILTQPTSNGRTHMDNRYNLVWNENDQVRVFGAENGTEYRDFTTPDFDNKEAAFAISATDAPFMANLDKNDNYFAFYPVQEGANVTMSVDNEQYYAAHSFANTSYPMYAKNTGENFVFESNAGVLRLYIRTSQAEEEFTITKIVVTSLKESDTLAAKIVYPYDYPLNRGTLNLSEMTNVVTLNCMTEEFPTGVNVNYQSLTDFNIILLEGALDGSFRVDVYGPDEMLLKSFTSTAINVNTIEAGVVTEMPDMELTDNN